MKGRRTKSSGAPSLLLNDDRDQVASCNARSHNKPTVMLPARILGLNRSAHATFKLAYAVGLLLVFFAAPAQAQLGSNPKHEFRGAWIATVINLDWPSCRNCPPAQQQAELLGQLDALKAAGLNAALFQVRAEADAFYPSALEPWSYWLTNNQGVAPSPAWDPLAFAVEEAHKRGMELHAWFNPYRADRGSGYPKAANHVTNTHPEWILDFTAIKILDPGIPAVRDYVTNVITDVVRRYDIDGVHFDDYFYPYPPNTITSEDAATFATYNGGFTDIGNWRRFNVFRLIRQVRDSIQVANPDVVFGISPFGIWRSGTPAGTNGLDAYSSLFADAVGWLQNDLIDYVTPQLYWAFGGGQDYGRLAPWWETQRNGRHYYPGHGLYRSDAATFTNTLFAANEIPRQVRFNRATPGIQGSVFFRAKNISLYSSRGFADSLRSDLYRHPALAPPMAWKNQTAPDSPTNLAVSTSGTNVNLMWDAPAAGLAPRFYAVYRVQAAAAPTFPAAPTSALDLLAVTGETFLVDQPAFSSQLYYYVVTSVSPNSIESVPSNVVSAAGTVVSAEEAPANARSLQAPRPNPVTLRSDLAFELATSSVVTLRVVDALGREVVRVLDRAELPAGPHVRTWTPGETVSNGTYFVVLEADGLRETQPLVVVR